MARASLTDFHKNYTQGDLTRMVYFMDRSKFFGMPTILLRYLTIPIALYLAILQFQEQEWINVAIIIGVLFVLQFIMRVWSIGLFLYKKDIEAAVYEELRYDLNMPSFKGFGSRNAEERHQNKSLLKDRVRSKWIGSLLWSMQVTGESGRLDWTKVKKIRNYVSNLSKQPGHYIITNMETLREGSVHVKRLSSDRTQEAIDYRIKEKIMNTLVEADHANRNLLPIIKVNNFEENGNEYSLKEFSVKRLEIDHNFDSDNSFSGSSKIRKHTTMSFPPEEGMEWEVTQESVDAITVKQVKISAHKRQGSKHKKLIQNMSGHAIKKISNSKDKQGNKRYLYVSDKVTSLEYNKLDELVKFTVEFDSPEKIEDRQILKLYNKIMSTLLEEKIGGYWKAIDKLMDESSLIFKKAEGVPEKVKEEKTTLAIDPLKLPKLAEKVGKAKIDDDTDEDEYEHLLSFLFAHDGKDILKLLLKNFSYIIENQDREEILWELEFSNHCKVPNGERLLRALEEKNLGSIKSELRAKSKEDFIEKLVVLQAVLSK